ASRAVLARIDAAEIGRWCTSPSTNALAVQPRPGGQTLPSTHASCGRTGSECTARRMASIEAWKMFRRSISSTVESATAQAVARSLIRAASTSRRSGVRSFESERPLMRRSGFRITAAAYTGPASGPRPASSMPQTSALFEDAEDVIGGILGLVLAQELVKFAEALHQAALRRGVAQQREQRAGEVRRRCLVLQELRHQALAGEDVRHADVREVQHLAHQRPCYRRLPVGDNHWSLEERRFEGRGTARHQHEIGGGERLVRVAEEQSQGQVGALVLVDRTLEELARLTRDHRAD